MQICGLLIAKSKSKRLPNKNILPVNGIPMFLINVKKLHAVFNRVYVSSDSSDILKKAESVGAIAIKRPRKLCGSVPNISVYNHALQSMFENNFVAVQANSPTVDIKIIRSAKKIMEDGYEEVMTCHPNYKPYGSVWGLTRDRVINYKNPRKPTPDVMIIDNCIDVHTQEDYNKVLKFYE